MGLFSFLGGASGNINTLVEEARQTKGAVIVDVRTPSEFSQGHTKGAHNIPLDRIDAITKVVTDKSTPLYLSTVPKNKIYSFTLYAILSLTARKTCCGQGAVL